MVDWVEHIANSVKEVEDESKMIEKALKQVVMDYVKEVMHTHQEEINNRIKDEFHGFVEEMINKTKEEIWNRFGDDQCGL